MDDGSTLVSSVVANNTGKTGVWRKDILGLLCVVVGENALVGDENRIDRTPITARATR